MFFTYRLQRTSIKKSLILRIWQTLDQPEGETEVVLAEVVVEAVAEDVGVDVEGVEVHQRVKNGFL